MDIKQYFKPAMPKNSSPVKRKKQESTDEESSKIQKCEEIPEVDQTVDESDTTTYTSQGVIKFSRKWAMPSADTFTIAPIKELLGRYIKSNMSVIDPFSRNSKFGTITNDLNPKTCATYHMDAIEFLEMLVKKETKADLVLYDPPYSPRQISECYKELGLTVSMQDTQNARLNKSCKDKIQKLLKVGGIAISCAWNSSGIGKTRGFEIVEILMVAHGASHNDTIITVEKKIKE